MPRTHAALCLLLSLIVSSQTVLSRRELWQSENLAARQALSRQDFPVFRDATEKLVTDFPGNARVLHDLVAAEARLGHTDASLTYLRRYLAMGLLPNFQSPSLKALRDSQKLDDWPEVRKNGQPVSSSTPVFKLSDANLIAEDIAYDSRDKKLFISSVHERKIIRCDMQGNCSDFVTSSSEQPLLGIFALHVDAKSKLLWATMAGMNAVAGFQPAEDGKSAALKFDLQSGKLLKRYDPSDDKKHALGDMTVGLSGVVYISDGLSGDVYAIDPKKDALEPLLPNGTFVSPQTPVLSDDGRILYVPDYTQGIAAIRLADRNVEWLKSNSPTATYAIDGMYAVKTRLIAIQNGTLPERIVEFTLEKSSTIADWKLLEGNTPYLGDPTHGVFVGDDFYFIANSGWDRMDEAKGELKAGTPAEVRKIAGLQGKAR